MHLAAEKSRKQKGTLFGLKVGLLLATVLSAWVTIVGLALGAHAFERIGLSWVQIVSLYYVALPLGGAASGAVEPLRRYAWGAMLQGFLLVLPVYVGVVVSIGLALGKVPSVAVGVIIGLLLAAFGGSTLGLWIWIEDRQKEREGTGTSQRELNERAGHSHRTTE